MCGFVGVRDGRAGQPAISRLDSALRAIRHRGPDDAGALVAKDFGLAHARLSIIDLSIAARQPMVDATGRFVLLFNGEIYNYAELAEEHLRDEPRLNRASDTAVLLAMYLRFGRDCVRYLDGMFAFAVVDLQTKAVFLARDRFGEKPLYWISGGSCFAFASEISSLRVLLPEMDWAIDPTALMLYHSIGSVPAPYTIYRAVRAVRPAQWMEIGSTGEVTTAGYWSIGESAIDVPEQKNEALEGVKKRLATTVRSRLVSDVPVGVFLSGGLDSGGIASVVASLGVSLPEALCIDFPDEQYSEYSIAERTAGAFGMRLHRSVITSGEFEEHLAGFFDVADQPTTDGFNSYFVSRHAAKLGIKVWLSGVGGDELFGGYPSFRRIRSLTALSRLLQAVLPRATTRQTAGWYPRRTRWGRVLQLGRQGDPGTRAYQCMRNIVPLSMVQRLMAPTLRMNDRRAVELLDGIYPDARLCTDRYQCTSMFESSVYMASQLLRDIDNFSMAHSIEVRAPFLDHRLFDYVYRMPEEFKRAKGAVKSLLVESLPLPLPRVVTSQPKRGFTFPVQLWLRDQLRSSFHEYALDERNSQFWDLNAVHRIWREYLRGRAHWSLPWQFYSFSRWHRVHHA